MGVAEGPLPAEEVLGDFLLMCSDVKMKFRLWEKKRVPSQIPALQHSSIFLLERALGIIIL